MKNEQRVFKPQMISSDVADIEVHVHEKPEGIYNVICPECEIAIASSSTYIEYQLRSITTMQLPGYGRSTFKGNAAEMTLDDHMAALDSVCPTDNAVLYGYSHCGYFITQYALKNTGKIKALVLVEPALFSEKKDLLERAALIDEGKDLEAMASMITTVDTAAGRTDEQLEWVAESLVKNVNSGNTVAQEYRIRAENELSLEALAELDIPVLLIAGTKSHANYMVKRAFQAIPQASVTWIDGANHLELGKGKYAKQIARAVDSFLENVTGANAEGTVVEARQAVAS